MTQLEQAPVRSSDIQGTASRDTAALKGRASKNADQLLVMQALGRGPNSADRIALAYGRDHASLRPRFTELADAGAIAMTGERVAGIAGGIQNVWRRARPEEVADLKAERKAARLERETRRFAKLLVQLGVSI
jgi:hypothetical protein